MKGMQAISRGSGFGGMTKYGLVNANGDLEGRIIGGNMSGRTAKELTKEFGFSRKLRPDIKKPVWHNSLRSPKDEKITDEQFNAFADDYMRRMGFTDAHQRVYIMHDDEKGRHIHIITSRIGLDGTIYYGKNENLKSSRLINRLEKVHGLVETKGPNIRGNLVMPDVNRPTFGEVGKFKRTGETPERQALVKLIDTAMADKPSASAIGCACCDSDCVSSPAAAAGRLFPLCCWFSAGLPAARPAFAACCVSAARLFPACRASAACCCAAAFAACAAVLASCTGCVTVVVPNSGGALCAVLPSTGVS